MDQDMHQHTVLLKLAAASRVCWLRADYLRCTSP